MSQNNDIEQLVSDPGFRNWVLQPDEISNRYWNSFVKNNPEKKEYVENARLLVLGLKQPETDFTTDDESILWDRIHSSIIEHETTESKIHKLEYSDYPQSKSSNIKWWYLAAASVGITIATWFGITQTPVATPEPTTQIAMVEKSVPKGQKLKLYLPDGSKVALNSNSKITYPSDFSDQSREVSIEGEAYFEVKRDSLRPFIVRSENLITEVLGTKFNVKSYNNSVESSVSLLEGSVKVRSKSKEVEKGDVEYITIIPGEQVNFNNASNQITKSKIKYNNELMWMNGVLAFNDEKIEKVFNKLEMWYGVKFEIENMPRDKKLTGKFANEYLDNVLQSINYTVKFKYKIDGDTVHVDFSK